MVGQTILNYRIEEKLGSGGMGVVYRAHDVRLDRDVALKFLPRNMSHHPEVKTRFLQEARAASALDHPNICNIYGLHDMPEGHQFISMAYYCGDLLKDIINCRAIDIRDAVDIALQIAQGLSCGHEAGITHRDIKPSNIIVTDRGEVKIVDFGLAKFQGASPLTLTGMIMGTPGYMSPEQASGRPVDHRTDIWSLGVVMYEMISGEAPYRGDNDSAVMHRLIHEDPPQLDIGGSRYSEKVCAIVRRAMCKDPEQRYQHIGELLYDLSLLSESHSARTASLVSRSVKKETPALVVLPFVEVASGFEMSGFCDGLTEQLISTLTGLQGLRVVSRTAAYQMRGRNMDVRQIGQDLNVDAILEGSVRAINNKVRISAQLINVADGFHLWSRQFDRTFSNFLQLQDEVSKNIAGEIAQQFSLPAQQSTALAAVVNPMAYQHYIKGRHFWLRRTVGDVKKGLRQFRQALQDDVSYAPVYAGLADSYNVLAIYGACAPTEVLPKAVDAARHALTLDSRLPEAHISLGCTKSIYEWDWLQAEEEFSFGLELNNDYAIGHQWYALNYLTPMGRFKEAAACMSRAVQLEPACPVVNVACGVQQYFARNYEASLVHYREALDLDPNFGVANLFMGQSYVQCQDFERAVFHLERAQKICGEQPNILANLGFALAKSGRNDVALRVLDRLLVLADQQYVSAYDIALVSLGMRCNHQALEWLQKGLEQKAFLMIYLAVDPALDALRSHPGFDRLLQITGLKEL